jgi:hypothetical protein
VAFCSLFNFDARLPEKICRTYFWLVTVLQKIYVSTWIFFVLCILLIISGIEIKPGPSVASESTSSFSSVESLSSNMSNLMTNSVSFLHLNIQSIVPKLDFIVAEYSCHDILSFTESCWNQIFPLTASSYHATSLLIGETGYIPFRRECCCLCQGRNQLCFKTRPAC